MTLTENKVSISQRAMVGNQIAAAISQRAMVRLPIAAAIDDAALKKIIDFIFQRKELDLESYRRNFLVRRLSLRLQATKSEGPREYLKLLWEDPQEISRFLDNLSINVTEFFRDPEVFEAFRKTALRDILTRKQGSCRKVIRLWSAGCANGEEAYSLAITAALELGERSDFRVKVWGRDIDEAALEKAGKGEYAAQSLQKIDKRILGKYFIPANNNSYRICDKVRQMVEFKRCNLADEPPFKLLDAIFCRNVMIYLSRPQKDDLFSRFHCLLNPGGYLVLSKVETLWEKNRFQTILPKEKIYQKIG